MQFTEFGNTGLTVSRIGLGTAALGRPGYINLGHGDDFKNQNSVSGMHQRTQQMLDHAYSKGVRYFDTARSYGRGEEFLGNWMKEMGNEMVIGSKWGYTYTADWQINAENHEIKDHSIQVLNRQWKETLNNLRPSIYHIHSATLESGVLENNEVLDGLWKLKEDGIIIGLSLSGRQQGVTLEKAMEIKNNEKFLFQSVQATWNLLEVSAGKQLQKAAESGWGVIIKESVANGRLTSRNTNEDFRDKYQLLLEMARKNGVHIDAVAMAYVMNNSWAHIVLSGASNLEQLESNLASLEVNFTEHDLDQLEGLSEPSEDYWKIRSGMAWN